MELIVLAKDYWGLLLGFVSLVAWLIRTNLRTTSNESRIESLEQIMKTELRKLETRIDRERIESKEARLQTDNSISALRTEVQSGFTQVNSTLEKVIFKLGDKVDK